MAVGLGHYSVGRGPGSDRKIRPDPHSSERAEPSLSYHGSTEILLYHSQISTAASDPHLTSIMHVTFFK